MQLLIDHGRTDYRWLLDEAVDDDSYLGRCCASGWSDRPKARTCAEVPNWRDNSESCKNMPILVPGRGHPAGLQTIDGLYTMVESSQTTPRAATSLKPAGR